MTAWSQGRDGGQNSLHDLDRMNRLSSVSSQFRMHMAHGELQEAKELLKKEMAAGEEWRYAGRAAKVYYELGEYADAMKYFDIHFSTQPKHDRPSFGRAVLEAKALLYRSAAAGKAPDWTRLSDLDRTINPAHILLFLTKQSISSYCLRSARFLLKELPKLGVDHQTIKLITDSLKKKQEEQRKFQEAERAKPISRPLCLTQS